jgi:hypothetical protein
MEKIKAESESYLYDAVLIIQGVSAHLLHIAWVIIFFISDSRESILGMETANDVAA